MKSKPQSPSQGSDFTHCPQSESCVQCSAVTRYLCTYFGLGMESDMNFLYCISDVIFAACHSEVVRSLLPSLQPY